jgi:large subunit ribosomal protein L1
MHTFIYTFIYISSFHSPLFQSIVALQKKDDGPYRNQDETIELALNLNLDPRKPGQAIRGSLSLPHGTGKRTNIIVFTSDDGSDTIQAAKDAGASHAGGQSLIESIQNGDIPVTFDRALATPDMMPQLSKIARILGPRGLMPNAKLDTIQPAAKIADAVKAQAAGMVQYRTDKNGIVHAGVGKGSFSDEALTENIREFMTAIQGVKPDSFGKGKKKDSGGGKGKSSGTKKDAKFYLTAYLSSTQGKGSVNIDLRTLDPTSASFMGVAVA